MHLILLLIGCPTAPELATPRDVHTVLPPMTPPPDLFEQLEVDATPTVSVELSDAAYIQLREAPREWVEGTLIWNGELQHAEIRLKGNGSFQVIDERPSLKVRFDRPFHGIQTLILNNGHSDPTRLHEVVASEAFQMLGLPAARAVNAWVDIKGRNVGLYTALEDVDTQMMKRWDLELGGLYELFDGDFDNEGLAGFTIEEGEPNPEALQAVADDLDLGDVVGFRFAVEHFHREEFFRFWAATAVLGQTDAYPYSRPGDDVYVHIDPDGKLTLIPHGLDEAFLPRGRRIAQTNGLLARRCLVVPSCREEFYDTLDQVTDELRELGFDERMAHQLDRSRDLWTDPRWVMPAELPPVGHLEDLADWLDVREERLRIERL